MDTSQRMTDQIDGAPGTTRAPEQAESARPRGRPEEPARPEDPARPWEPGVRGRSTYRREPARLARERTTIGAMIRIACRDWHGTDEGLCEECRELEDFANIRLDKCPFGERKPTCANCPVHCYKPEMRERIRAVMRHAGPRMYKHHPVLTLHHLLDSLRKAPELPTKKRSKTASPSPREKTPPRDSSE